MKQRVAILMLILVCFLLMAAVQVSKPYISRYFCVGCGDCVKHCPVSAITLVSGKAVIDTDKCINCGLCSKTCNYIAVRKPQVGKELP